MTVILASPLSVHGASFVGSLADYLSVGHELQRFQYVHHFLECVAVQTLEEILALDGFDERLSRAQRLDALGRLQLRLRLP